MLLDLIGHQADVGAPAVVALVAELVDRLAVVGAPDARDAGLHAPIGPGQRAEPGRAQADETARERAVRLRRRLRAAGLIADARDDVAEPSDRLERIGALVLPLLVLRVQLVLALLLLQLAGLELGVDLGEVGLRAALPEPHPALRLRERVGVVLLLGVQVDALLLREHGQRLPISLAHQLGERLVAREALRARQLGLGEPGAVAAERAARDGVAEHALLLDRVLALDVRGRRVDHPRDIRVHVFVDFGAAEGDRRDRAAGAVESGGGVVVVSVVGALHVADGGVGAPLVGGRIRHQFSIVFLVGLVGGGRGLTNERKVLLHDPRIRPRFTLGRCRLAAHLFYSYAALAV